MVVKINDRYINGGISSSGTKVCVIVPTYNEAGNIIKLLDTIFSVDNVKKLESNDIHLHVLVVDDNSPDKTAKLVEKYRKNNPNVHLLLRQQKNGLGAAYIAGMKYAISNFKPEIVFEMDADFSHDPSYIVPMIQEIRNGADFVIGSRYVAGGKLPDDWGFQRRLISKTANAYARIVLGMKNVKDCTGGFRAIRAAALEKINLDSLNVKGYVFQISLLNSIIKNKCIVRELPIRFHDRAHGKSKMRLADIIEVGIVVLKLAARDLFSFDKDEILESYEFENAQHGHEFRIIKV